MSHNKNRSRKQKEIAVAKRTGRKIAEKEIARLRRGDVNAINRPRPPKNSVLNNPPKTKKAMSRVHFDKNVRKLIDPAALAYAQVCEDPFKCPLDSNGNFTATIPVTNGTGPCKQTGYTVHSFGAMTTTDLFTDIRLYPEGFCAPDTPSTSSLLQIGAGVLNRYGAGPFALETPSAILNAEPAYAVLSASSTRTVDMFDEDGAVDTANYEPLLWTTKDVNPKFNNSNFATDGQSFRLVGFGFIVRYEGALDATQGSVESWQSYEMPESDTPVDQFSTNGAHQRTLFAKTTDVETIWKPNCDSFTDRDLNYTAVQNGMLPCRMLVQVEAPTGTAISYEAIAHYAVVIPDSSTGTVVPISHQALQVKNAVATSFASNDKRALSRELHNEVEKSNPLLKKVGRSIDEGLAGNGAFETIGAVLSALF